MGGNTAFAIISVSVMVSSGLAAALIQFGIVLYVFSKWGFSDPDSIGRPVLYFLSDLFVIQPGIAYAWALSVIPSLTIALTIITTSVYRDFLIWGRMIDTKPPYNLTIFAWIVALFGQWGLILIAYFDLHHRSRMHYLGVALFASSGLIFNVWVVFLDYGVRRMTWHPVFFADCALSTVSVVALIFFVFGSNSVSAASEWCVLLLMSTLHMLLPIRGARIVLSHPNILYNSGRRSPIVVSDTTPPPTKEAP